MLIITIQDLEAPQISTHKLSYRRYTAVRKKNLELPYLMSRMSPSRFYNPSLMRNYRRDLTRPCSGTRIHSPTK